VAQSFDLNDLSLDNIDSWPFPVKVVACVLVAALIIGMGYWFDTRHQSSAIAREKRQERELKQQFETKQQRAANYEVYKTQLVEMQRKFASMLRQLPTKSEVPGLLEDISRSGVASGLEFQLFDPLEEVEHEFYVELPILISVTGEYHDLGRFISQVADLHRIVTLHDFDISFKEDKKSATNKKSSAINKKNLVMEVTAKTYHYSTMKPKAKTNNKPRKTQ
jgi:type IV pilus assembly protein PilO